MKRYQTTTIKLRGDGVASITLRSDTPGLSDWSFYTGIDRFLDLLQTTYSSQADLFACLFVSGDQWTLVNAGPAHDAKESSGAAFCRYVRLYFPLRHRQQIAERLLASEAFKFFRAGEHIQASSTLDMPSEVIEISQEDATAIANQFGQGTGQVQFDFSSPVIQGQFEECQAAYRGEDTEAAKTWDQCIDQLTRIAKNTTWAATDVGVVKITYDFAGFGFHAGSLIGGFIHHNAEAEDGGSWSLHT